MAARRRAERPIDQPRRKLRPTSTRLEELRDLAIRLIERSLVEPFELTLPEYAAEGERIRGLYTPIFIDLQQRARAASTLEELDEIMARHARLVELLNEEARRLQELERRDLERESC